MNPIVCTYENFHPYECGGPPCRHCVGHEGSYLCALCLDGRGLMDSRSYLELVFTISGWTSTQRLLPERCP